MQAMPAAILGPTDSRRRRVLGATLAAGVGWALASLMPGDPPSPVVRP
jgi:hypothetical protein